MPLQIDLEMFKTALDMFYTYYKRKGHFDLLHAPLVLSTYKARHAHKCLYTVLPKYSKIQVLPGITSCRLMKDNKQAIELNDLLKK